MERLGDLGYIAVGKQSGSSAVTPGTFLPLYSEDLSTNLNYDEDNPAVGIKFARYQTLQGQRDHQGPFTVIGEPNTAGYVFNMLLNKSGTSGSDPYTHTYTDGGDSDAYTVDVCPENHVYRYKGLKASQISPSFNDNYMHLQVTASALAAFSAAAVDSVSGTGPYTVTLKTDYDPAPTTALVAGDLIKIYDVSVDSYIDATIDSVDNDTDFTVSEDVSAATADDVVTIRPQSTSFDNLTPFQFARSEWRLSDTAANALSAAHTPMDEFSWTVSHNFNNDGGEKRSGSYDPASLARTQTNAELTATKFFDTSDQIRKFVAKEKQGLVIRHFSEGSSYELRLTFNDVRISDGGKPPINTGETLLHNFAFLPNYDAGDGQAFDVKVINGISSI